MTDSSAHRWSLRPTLSSSFYKAHGLGNDYLVFEEVSAASPGPGWAATPTNVARVCDPHRGIGSDGIVVLEAGKGQEALEPDATHVSLRMFNPDGGEFERSGNGLRVLASFLALRDPGLRVIHASVGGGRVTMLVHGRDGPAFDISVDMGRASTGPSAIDASPGLMTGDGAPWMLPGPAGEKLAVVPVSVGNPHLVVLPGQDAADDLNESRLTALGPFLSGHDDIANGTNVQLARVRSQGVAEALIWERGVGRTAASGTSACAVAVALVKSGRIAPGRTTVDMPGGQLVVDVTEALDVVLRGPVEAVFSGTLDPELLLRFERAP